MCRFVLQESKEVIHSLLAVAPASVRPFFYRTSAGAEIDLVLELGDGTLWAIEIKRSLSARVKRGFYLACADIKPTRAFVVYAGDDCYPVSETVEAVSIHALAQKLRALDY